MACVSFRWLSCTAMLLAGCVGKVEFGGSGRSFDLPRGPVLPVPGPAWCDKAAHAGVTLAQVRQDFESNVYPLLTRPAGGCVACHAPGLGRLFEVRATAAETFAAARLSGALDPDGAGSILGRLKTFDTFARMPKYQAPWPAADLGRVEELVCKLEAYLDDSCGASVSPGASRVRRLMVSEYQNTVRDLLREPALAEVDLPADPHGTVGFNNDAEIQQVDNLWVNKLMLAAESLAAKVVPARYAACMASAPDVACARTFIREFGRRAFRRPLTATEQDRFDALYATARSQAGSQTNPVQWAARWVVEAMLQSSPFLYKLEQEGSGAPDPVIKLSGFEVASRLSYHFLATMPDDAMLELAASGGLSTPEQILEKAQELARDSRAKRPVADFNAQWSGLAELRYEVKDEAIYPGFATVKPLMETELAMFLEDAFWNADASALLTADHTFANDALATFYGLPGGRSGSAFQRVPLDTSKRRGLLTLGGFLAVHAESDASDPVRRGRFVREKLLCQRLPPPPGVIPELPPATPTTTTRQRYEAHRADACYSCHVLMDPVGFTFERFAGDGSYRLVESGQSVDPSGGLAMGGDLDGPVADVLELTEQLSGSASYQSCMALQWYRYSFGHNETADDECAIRQARAHLAAANGDLRQLWVGLTQLDAFLYRRTP